MFTFRRFTLLFFLVMLVLNLWNFFPGKSPGGFIDAHATLLYSTVVALYLGISVALSFLPCTNFHHPVTCCGSTEKKVVSVTFDDGPDMVNTPAILEILKKHDVRATFFCIGKKLGGNEKLMKQLTDNGHLVGNHGYTHSGWFDLLPARKIRAELEETDRLIKIITGKSPLFFRPPFGVVNPMVSNAVKNTHWKVVCWNIRSLDTMTGNSRKIRDRILRKLKPGAIILLHDHTTFTGHYLDDLLSKIQEKGFSIIPLDELLNMQAYAS